MIIWNCSKCPQTGINKKGAGTGKEEAAFQTSKALYLGI